MKLTGKGYIENGGNNCPFCASRELEGGFIEVDAGSAHQPVHCIRCDKEWHDVYTLTAIFHHTDSGDYVEIP